MLTKQSAIKWPSVPNVYNWLMLDGRGNWLIKREKISHKGLIDFINAQYTADDTGRWFFQNGPQRVFVTLECTPYVLSVETDDSFMYFKTHTGQAIKIIDKLWIDNIGRLLVSWNGHIGLVSDRDLPYLTAKLNSSGSKDQINLSDLDFIKHQTQSGSRTPLNLIMNETVHNVLFINELQISRVFGFDCNPQPPQGDPDC